MDHTQHLSHCEDCSLGGCASGGCSGCHFGEITLFREELMILLDLGQLAFLPILTRSENQGPVYAPAYPYSQGETPSFSDLIRSLNQKGLLTIDPDIPLENADYGSFASDGALRRGSLALTAKGQEVLDWISPKDLESPL